MKLLARTIFLLISVVSCSAEQQAKVSDQPLSQEQQAIYRTFLSKYSNGAETVVNLSERTAVFQPSDIDLKGCMRGIDLATNGPNAVHVIDPSVLPNQTYRLVNPEQQFKKVKKSDPGKGIKNGKPVEDAVKEGFANGLLVVSEIAFSRDHHYAFLQYSFSCGSLCGNRALVVYEKDGVEWKVAKGKFCSFSMS